MSVISEHKGNIQPYLDLEEHDGDLFAKKTSLVSAATIYAVVNTGSAGNTTLNPSPNFIGLVTAVHGSNVTLNASNAFIGLVSVAQPINANVSLGASVQYIGLVSVAQPINANVSLSASAAYIGLATVVPDFGSNVTVHTQVISSTGNTTIFVAPASNRFFLTNLHVASLGRSEIEIRSGATTLIPFTALSTTAGYIHNFNNPGLPSRAQADGFVVNLNGAATISIMASWYARP